MLLSSRTVASTFAVFAFACVLAGCSASSSPSSSSAAPGDDGCGSAPVSFQKDVIPIFAGNCTSTTICHGQTDDPGVENLYLGLTAGGGTNGPADIAMVYAGLVGAKAVEDPSMNLVTDSDLENSYLWHKVNGDENSDSTVVSGCQPVANGPNACSDCIPQAPCGVQMPLGSSLEPSAICVLQSWIAQGALNN
jgi:hypothetical protein